MACTEKCHFRCLVGKLQYGGERLFCKRCVLNTLPQKKENYYIVFPKSINDHDLTDTSKKLSKV